MKKMILLSLVGILCLPVTVYGLSIGGAETQGKGKIALGLEGEYVFDRDLKTSSVLDTIKNTYLEIKFKPELDRMSRGMLKISYGLFDGLDVYGKIGAADFKIKDGIGGSWIDESTGDEGLLGGNFKVDSETAFAYGGGIKGNLKIGKNWLIGVDVQYLRHKDDVSGSVLVYNVAHPKTERRIVDLDRKMTVQEWHFASYLARKLGNFTPYLGVKYSDLRMKLNDIDNISLKFNAKDRFGTFLGTDYKIGKHFRLNLEGRFVDERAVSSRISYRF